MSCNSDVNDDDDDDDVVDSDDVNVAHTSLSVAASVSRQGHTSASVAYDEGDGARRREVCERQ